METPAVTIQPVSQKKKSGLAPPPTPPPPPTKGQLSAPKPPPPPFTASTAQPCPPPPPKAKMSANKSQINNYNKHLEAVKKKSHRDEQLPIQVCDKLQVAEHQVVRQVQVIMI